MLNSIWRFKDRSKLDIKELVVIVPVVFEGELKGLVAGNCVRMLRFDYKRLRAQRTNG
jgi:hypothetical protein